VPTIKGCKGAEGAEDHKEKDVKSKSMTIFTAVMVVGMLAACAGNPSPSPGTESGPRFVLNLEPGPHYAKTVGTFPARYTVQPQVAVWLQTPGGKYIETVYVTARGEKGNWRMAPKEGRPEALPVWYHLKQGSADAVSSATATDSAVTYGNGIAARLPAGTYVVMLETNRSYDWNEQYTKDNAGVSGQPSIIYRAEITIGGGRTEARFVPFGTGSVDGSDGTVRTGLDGLDTALELFSSMKVSYEL